jgi:hypothetical protein
MPRITDSASDPHDFCQRCLPDEAEAEERFGLAACGEGPDGRGNCYDYCESIHPPYEEYPGEFTCDECGKELTARDNDLK